ncbi:MAG: hypothetical protein M1509_07290 [Nitrospirae bacterium]|nr:hypothetical protein [Nitrospirota bacterium]
MSSAGRSFSQWNPESFVRKAESTPSLSGDGGAASSPSREGGRTNPSSQKGRIPEKRRRGEDEAPSRRGETEEPELFDLSQKLEEVESRARAEGYEAGYAAGQRQIADEMAPFRQAWLDWAAQVPDFEERRLEAMAPRMVEILDKAFRRVLGESLSAPEGVRSLLGRLAREYAAGRTADLLVSPDDFQRVTRFDPEFVREMQERGVRVAASPDLSGHRVELRFQDRIVSFDPEEAAGSFRGALSGALPEVRAVDEEGGDDHDRA